MSFEGPVGSSHRGGVIGARTVWPPTRISALNGAWAAHQLLQENTTEPGRSALTGVTTPFPVIRCGLPFWSSTMTATEPSKWQGLAAERTTMMAVFPVAPCALARATTSPPAHAASGKVDAEVGVTASGDGDGTGSVGSAAGLEIAGDAGEVRRAVADGVAGGVAAVLPPQLLRTAAIRAAATNASSAVLPLTVRAATAASRDSSGRRRRRQHSAIPLGCPWAAPR